MYGRSELSLAAVDMASSLRAPRALALWLSIDQHI